ncbi:hypothetical protein [Ochrobactrum sp. C6C9]|uniref:hypothetical protein n=1 Tax=Ochrobactrum sp. C6C9 TaxID=2736662 RepID=UPI0035304B0D
MQLHTRHEEVQLDTILMRVPDPKDIALILCHTGKSQILEPVTDFALLIIRWAVIAFKRDHA